MADLTRGGHLVWLNMGRRPSPLFVMNIIYKLLESYRMYLLKRKLRRLIKKAKAMKYKPLVIPPEDTGFGC